MNVTPTGLLSTVLQAAKLSLSTSPTCQSLLQAGTIDQAQTRIFTGETDEHAASDIRPRILLDVLEGMTWEKTSTTNFLGTGTVEAVFEIPAPPQYLGLDGRRDQRDWFYNAIGNVLQEVMPYCGLGGGYLNILKFTIQVIGRADPKENDGQDFWVAVVDMDWKG